MTDEVLYLRKKPDEVRRQSDESLINDFWRDPKNESLYREELSYRIGLTGEGTFIAFVKAVRVTLDISHRVQKLLRRKGCRTWIPTRLDLYRLLERLSRDGILKECVRRRWIKDEALIRKILTYKWTWEDLLDCSEASQKSRIATIECCVFYHRQLLDEYALRKHEKTSNG